MAITIYTAPNCQQCRMTESRMASKGLSFRIIRLDNEPTIAAKLRSQGYTQAPVVDVTGEQRQTWTGFRPDLIDLLAQNQGQ